MKMCLRRRFFCTASRGYGKLYYERGNRLRMENKTRSAKVLSLIKQCGGVDISIIDNEVAHTSAVSAHIREVQIWLPIPLPLP